MLLGGGMDPETSQSWGNKHGFQSTEKLEGEQLCSEVRHGLVALPSFQDSVPICCQCLEHWAPLNKENPFIFPS